MLRVLIADTFYKNVMQNYDFPLKKENLEIKK